MSIKGRPSRWFEAAVHRGDLTAALSETHELPRPLPLTYALALVVLLGDVGDPRHPRWAARWAGRLALERDTVDLPALAELVTLLAATPAFAGGDRHQLGILAGRHGALGAEALLAAIPKPPARP